MQTAIQNKSVIFHTNGPIDPISWEMLGVSAKQDDSAIGQFGTGLSYAIAVLIRTGHQIEIRSEGKLYNFTTQEIDFRGKSFDQILCNGKALPFPTHYGKKWDVWMAYRELVSNTMDEGGLWFAGEAMLDGTSIVVTGVEIMECLENHNRYFVGDREPVVSGRILNLHKGNGTVYHKGVKVGGVPGGKHSYDIHRFIDLTEDRTIKYNFEVNQAITRFYINETEDEKLIKQFICLNDSSYEATLDCNYTWSDAFTKAVTEMWEKAPTKLRGDLARLLKERNPSLQWDAVEPDEDQETMIAAALDFLKKAGYNEVPDISVVENADDMNVAFVHQDRVFLTEKAFEKGLYFLVTVLFEEIHHCLGYDDFSRAFQTHLIEQVVNQAKKRLHIAL